ncbi:MAG: hypothetical protein ACJ76I_11870 [Gaiellaceae bacterium]
MAGGFVNNDPWDVEILVDGETKHVQLRELSSSDAATLDDLLAIGEEGDTRLNAGTRRLLEVQRSVVSWDLGKPCTPETVSQLTPQTFKLIADHVDRGRPGSPTTPASEPEPTHESNTAAAGASG